MWLSCSAHLVLHSEKCVPKRWFSTVSELTTRVKLRIEDCLRPLTDLSPTLPFRRSLLNREHVGFGAGRFGSAARMWQCGRNVFHFGNDTKWTTFTCAGELPKQMGSCVSARPPESGETESGRSVERPTTGCSISSRYRTACQSSGIHDLTHRVVRGRNSPENV